MNFFRSHLSLPTLLKKCTKKCTESVQKSVHKSVQLFKNN